jgi:hypothetical protein
MTARKRKITIPRQLEADRANLTFFAGLTDSWIERNFRTSNFLMFGNAAAIVATETLFRAREQFTNVLPLLAFSAGLGMAAVAAMLTKARADETRTRLEEICLRGFDKDIVEKFRKDYLERKWESSKGYDNTLLVLFTISIGAFAYGLGHLTGALDTIINHKLLK